MAQKYGIAIDYRRCIGCGSCSVSCKLENNLPNDVWYCTVNTVGGASKDCPGGSYGANTIAYQPLRCQHCENPACVAVCPTGATAKDEETGIVTQDTETCIGCQSCIEACPYQAVGAGRAHLPGGRTRVPRGFPRGQQRGADPCEEHRGEVQPVLPAHLRR